VASSHGYQALRQIAGRVVPAATTRRPSAAPSPSQHRLGELLLVWNGYDDNSALCSVRKPDRHTSDGFQTCSAASYPMKRNTGSSSIGRGPWEEKLTAAARSVAPRNYFRIDKKF